MAEMLPDLQTITETDVLLDLLDTPEYTTELFTTLYARTPQVVRHELEMSMPNEMRLDPALKEIYWRQHLLDVYVTGQTLHTKF